VLILVIHTSHLSFLVTVVNLSSVQETTNRVNMTSDNTQAQLHKELTAAAAELSLAVDAFGQNSQFDDANRQKIVSAAQRILSSARDPNAQWMDDALEMGRLAAMHLFQVWGGFGQIPAEGSISFAELAGKLQTETSVIGMQRSSPHGPRPTSSLLAL